MMLTERVLRNRRGIALTQEERALIEGAISDVRTIGARHDVVSEGVRVRHATLLVDGMVSRYIDDRHGMRQLVGIHVPGDFVDLQAYALRRLDHNVGTLTPVTIAILPYPALDRLLEARPELARKLWYSTLLDGATQRAWLFRLGRLDSVGRVAHFLSEINARLEAVGLSDGARFPLPITQSDLAEACGLTSVHVNRVMRTLRESGLCVFRSATVDVADRAGLERRGDFSPNYLYLARRAPTPGTSTGTIAKARATP